jgi:ubiquinone/menaquinone biosynthesis C-methylase UbiE
MTDAAAEANVVDASGWSASLYNKNASFVYSASFTNAVLELLAAKPGERIFDFGCGSGEVTLQIAEMVGDDGLVVGVDSSETMASAVYHRSEAIGLRYASDLAQQS